MCFQHLCLRAERLEGRLNNRSLKCSQHVLLLFFCFVFLVVFFFRTPDEGFCFVESRARTHNVRNKTQTSTPLESRFHAASPAASDLFRVVEFCCVLLRFFLCFFFSFNPHGSHPQGRVRPKLSNDAPLPFFPSVFLSELQQRNRKITFRKN